MYNVLHYIARKWHCLVRSRFKFCQISIGQNTRFMKSASCRLWICEWSLQDNWDGFRIEAQNKVTETLQARGEERQNL